MRAHYYPELSRAESYTLQGDSLHHLVNVVRIEVGEELLLLNGKGCGALTKVTSISKKDLRLSFLEWKEADRKVEWDLALGIPKKDALDLCLKQATELGFRRIYLIRGAFSQTKVPEADRMTNVLVSALEQANAFYLPEVIESDWEALSWEKYPSALLLDSQSKNSSGPITSTKTPVLLIVGPEGGFSGEELSFLRAKKNVESVYLPTPILRTPTALAAGAGVLLQRLMD